MTTRRGSSGQVLVVSALVIALIMISTATYIYNLSGNIGDSEPYLLNDYVQSIILGSKHAVVSALANITNGGDNETLAADLDAWSTAVGRQYTFGTLALNYTVRSTPPYASGLYLNWTTPGNGISEAYADFGLNASGTELKMQYPFYVNVSTGLGIEGYLTQVSSLTEQVTVVCRFLNEGQPALAQNVTVFYKDSGAWLSPSVADDYALLDYGNGTYRATFTLVTSATSLDISACVFDSRNIFVRANATITQQ
jgi:hypothetical protein